MTFYLYYFIAVAFLLIIRPHIENPWKSVLFMLIGIVTVVLISLQSKGGKHNDK